VVLPPAKNCRARKSQDSTRLDFQPDRWPVAMRRALLRAKPASAVRPRSFFPPTGDRGVEKPRLGEPHAPLGFRPEHTRVPPRPHGRGVLRRRTKAAKRGVLTAQDARVGRPACNIPAGIGFTKRTVANPRGALIRRRGMLRQALYWAGGTAAGSRDCTGRLCR